jgi:hypothetical protein
MRIIGCDLHSRQQTLAMLDTATGEVERTTLRHEGNNVREFYSKLPRPVRVGKPQVGNLKTPHYVLVSADLPRSRSGSAPIVFFEQLTFGL